MNWISGLTIGLSGLSAAGIIAGFLLYVFKVSKQMGTLQENIADVLASFRAFQNSVGVVVVKILADKDILTPNEVNKVNEPFRNVAMSPIDRLMGRLGTQATGNPLTADEVQQLRNYVRKYERGELLSPEEAEDFYRLSREIEREEKYRRDAAATLLAGLAGFLLGLIVGKTLTE